MNPQELKKRLKADPFQPFTIMFPSGSSYTIYSSDQALMLGDGRSVVVPDPVDGTADIFDVIMIERIQTLSENPKPRMWWLSPNGH